MSSANSITISPLAKYSIQSSGRLVYALGMLTMLTALAIDSYLPAIPAMAEEFGVQVHQMGLTISIFFIGFALGQMIGGPMSDRLGRKPVALFGLLLYCMASFWIASVTSVQQMLFLRVIQAFGGGFAIVNSNAIVRDLYEGKESARMLSLISSITMLGPVIAPILGMLILSLSGWRSIFMFLGTFAGIMLVVINFLGESNKNLVIVSRVQVFKNYLSILRSPKAMGFILAAGFASAAMFVFITESAFIYQEYFGVSYVIFPFLFGANVVLLILFARLNARLVKQYPPINMLRIGQVIQLSSISTLVILVASGMENLFVVVPLVVLSIGSIGLISGNAIAGALSYFRDMAGTASALVGVIVYGLGGIAGALVTTFHDGSILEPFVGMLICSVMSILMLHGIRWVVHKINPNFVFLEKIDPIINKQGNEE